MQRSSKYFHLRYVVECKPAGQHFFETIAAFNLGSVALEYMSDCSKGKPPGFQYRVQERKTNSRYELLTFTE